MKTRTELLIVQLRIYSEQAQTEHEQLVCVVGHLVPYPAQTGQQEVHL